MILLYLTLSFTLVTSVPYDYNFIYPPMHNTSLTRPQDPTYHLQDLFEYGDTSQCKRNATCIPLDDDSTCFGISLPYDSTSLDLVPGHATQSSIKRRLRMLQTLKSIPKCWSVVRPFLCSLFIPKCVNGTVERLSQSMCLTVLHSCRLALNQTIWPKFISCDNEDLFMPQCHTIVRDMKFNKSWNCPVPLVPTNNSQAAFDGIDACGVPCHDPMYNYEEHQQTRTFIAWGATTCCCLNFFAVITFLIDWKSANKFPASVIFYINGCFMLCCLGWLVQFSADNSDVIVCRLDGTLRKSEPNGDLACVLIFILVYYPLMSAIIWFVILTYTWHISIQPYSKLNTRLDKRSAYFHLIAWCVPLMLTVGVLGMSEVDGDSMTGICFIGRYNYTMRMGFVLGPVVAAMIIGGYFLVRGMTRLISLTISSEGIVTEKASSKLRNTIVRMGLFSVAIICSVIMTIHCHVYDFTNNKAWEQSFRNYIICSISTHFSSDICKIGARPSVTKLQLHLFSLFFTGIIMSSWVWTSSSLEIWLRFIKRYMNFRTFATYFRLSSRLFIYLLIRIYRLFTRKNLGEDQQQQNQQQQEPLKLQKHEVIAQAYNKRQAGKELDWKGDTNPQISIDYYNDDPVGLNFDPNSVESQDISATWAAALPYMVVRRGAVVREMMKSDSNESRCDNRRSSNESYSFSMRRVSIESRRRNSNDSQISMSISELTAHGPCRISRDQYRDVDTSTVNKRGKRRTKVKNHKLKGYKVPKSRRTARSYVGNSQDTPAIDTDY